MPIRGYRRSEEKLLHPYTRHLVFDLAVVLRLEALLFFQRWPPDLLEQKLLKRHPCWFPRLGAPLLQ